MVKLQGGATKIREYLSAYEGIDPTKTVTTDVDLPACYNAIEGKILPKNIKVVDDVLVGTTTDLETYPNKNRLDNSSYRSAASATSGTCVSQECRLRN